MQRCSNTAEASSEIVTHYEARGILTGFHFQGVFVGEPKGPDLLYRIGLKPPANRLIHSGGHCSFGIGCKGNEVQTQDIWDFSDNAAVTDDYLLGTEAAASFQYDSDDQTRRIGYIGGKRYTRLTITPANNTSAALMSVLTILGHPVVAPVA